MKHHRARPAKKTAVIDVRLSDELKDAFTAQCQEDDQTVSEVLRDFITAHLRARSKQKAAQRFRRSLLKMIGSIRMLLASGASGAAALTAAVMMAPVAVHVAAVAPQEGATVSPGTPATYQYVALFEVSPEDPATGPEVTPMPGGQMDGAVRYTAEVTFTP